MLVALNGALIARYIPMVENRNNMRRIVLQLKELFAQGHVVVIHGGGRFLGGHHAMWHSARTLPAIQLPFRLRSFGDFLFRTLIADDMFTLCL